MLIGSFYINITLSVGPQLVSRTLNINIHTHDESLTRPGQCMKLLLLPGFEFGQLCTGTEVVCSNVL